MLDLTAYKSRYYEVKISDNDIVHLENPKKKQLKILLSLTKKVDSKNLTEEDMDALYEAALIAFNKNKERRTFTEEEIDELLGLNALYDFFKGYYSWVADNVSQKNQKFLTILKRTVRKTHT